MTFDKDIVAVALGICKECGIDDARITLLRGIENSVVVDNDRVDKLHQASSSSLYIQILVKQRYGAFSTNIMDPDVLRKFIRQAAESTAMLTIDECMVLPDKALYYRGGGADLKQYDSAIETLSSETRIETAMNIGREVIGTDRRLLSVEAEYGDSVDYVYMADTQGFVGESILSNFSISAECSIIGKGEEKPKEWWYEGSMFFDGLKKTGCGTMALERALRRLKPVKLRSGKYNAVIENSVASKMVAPIISALNGAALQQRNSFLIDSIAKNIFPAEMNLVDTPHLPGMMGSRYFDGEGVATRNMSIIEHGVVNTYFINSYYGKKMGIQPTIEGPSVLKFAKDGDISGKELSLAAIIKSTERGILITGFNGGNSNSATGDFSYGVQGFYFEHGEIVHPIREMNITGNLIELWSNLLLIGDDPRDCMRWQIPTLSFGNCVFNGI